MRARAFLDFYCVVVVDLLPPDPPPPLPALLGLLDLATSPPSPLSEGQFAADAPLLIGFLPGSCLCLSESVRAS